MARPRERSEFQDSHGYKHNLDAVGTVCFSGLPLLHPSRLRTDYSDDNPAAEQAGGRRIL